jgi:hypothetical protein
LAHRCQGLLTWQHTQQVEFSVHHAATTETFAQLQCMQQARSARIHTRTVSLLLQCELGRVTVGIYCYCSWHTQLVMLHSMLRVPSPRCLLGCWCHHGCTQILRTPKPAICSSKTASILTWVPTDQVPADGSGSCGLTVVQGFGCCSYVRMLPARQSMWTKSLRFGSSLPRCPCLATHTEG